MRSVSVGTFKASDKTRELIARVLDSGQVSYGPLCQEFERRFAEMHESRYAILSNSGTSALQVALQALKEIHLWNDGDTVIVPATTFVATANIVLHNRMIPTFVDVDPLTYNIDTALIERAITDRTRAIIPVHLFGQPANMLRVNEIAQAHKLKVIEDSCEAMFVRHNGAMVGALGDIGCFSTYVAHLLVTGVGGISTTSNPDYAARMRSLVNHGLELSHLNPDENFAPRPTPGRRFKFSSVGHSYRITELEAALGLAQLDGVNTMLDDRRHNASHLTLGLRQINRKYHAGLQLPEVSEGNECAWMMYPILLPIGQSKEPLMAHLLAAGVECRDMLPLINQPAYKRRVFPSDYPISQWLIESGFYVGCHQNLTPDDIQYVIDSIAEFYGRPNVTPVHSLPALSLA